MSSFGRFASFLLYFLHLSSFSAPLYVFHLFLMWPSLEPHLLIKSFTQTWKKSAFSSLAQNERTRLQHIFELSLPLRQLAKIPSRFTSARTDDFSRLNAETLHVYS